MTRLLTLLLVLSAAAARAETREIGALVLDGVPPTPPALDEKLRPYFAVRGADVLEWDAKGGLLIGTRFGETVQVHRVERPLGQRRQLTFLPEPVREAVVARRRPEGFFYRVDRGGNEAYQYWFLDEKTGQERLFTDGKARNESLLASNRGDQLAWASTRRNGVDFDLWVAPAGDGEKARLVYEAKGKWAPLDWSPDDRRLLVKHYVSINESYLAVLDLASGALTPVDERPGGGDKVAYGAAWFARPGPGIYFVSDEGSELRRVFFADGRSKRVVSPQLAWDVDELALSPDGRRLAFSVNEAGRSALYLAEAAPGRVAATARRVALPLGVLSGLRFDPASRRLAFGLSTTDTLSDAWVLELATRRLTRWSESERGGLAGGFVAPELVHFDSFDGRRLDAWYYPAASDAAAGKRPVVIAIHGGPESQATAAFSPTIQSWVRELGVAVIAPNVRGSAGYGKSFLLLDNGERREDAVKDIGALLDWIEKRPELDAGRVAVYGGSYGGYMVLASLIHYGERLCCGVDVVGISNFVTFLERTEAYRRDLRRVEYGDERDPRMRAFLEAISPTTGAARLSRPLFVAQGANDPRVPRSEAEQIVATARKHGAPVWYLLARDEGHGFQKRANRDAFYGVVAHFWQKHLLP